MPALRAMEAGEKKDEWRKKGRASGSQIGKDLVVARLRSLVPDEFEDKAWENSDWTVVADRYFPFFRTMAEDSKATRLNDTVLVPSLGEAFPAIPKSTRALIAKALSSTYSEVGKLKRRANLMGLNSSVQKLVEALRATGGSESEAAMTPCFSRQLEGGEVSSGVSSY